MAQVGVQYPNLNEMFGSNSVFPTHFGLQREDLAQRSTKINQDQALQDMFDQEQKRPGMLREQELKNLMEEARMPGVRAQSSMLERNNTIEDLVGAPKMAAGKTADINEKLNKEEAAQIEKHAGELIRSGIPAQVKLGHEIIKSLPGFLREELKQEAQGTRRMKEIAAQGAEARKTQQQAIDAGRYAKSAGGGSAAADAKARLDPRYWMGLALDEEDPIKRAQHIQKAAQLQAIINEQKAAGANVAAGGKPDLAGMGVPTRTPPPAAVTDPGRIGPGTMPPGGPTVAPGGALKGPSTPAHNAWVEKAMKLNNMTREQAIAQGQKLGKF